LKNIITKLRSRVSGGILPAINQRIFYKDTGKAVCFQTCKKLLSNKIGLEIGGPSSIFQENDILPIYPIVKRLDNCNFAGLTTWEGNITKGLTFEFNQNSPKGEQYLTEASNLAEIASGKYDFVLSSHMLEHSANPLQAISEWLRVLKEDGILMTIVPHKNGTFDHQRPTTSLEHLIEDFESGTKEDDLTHLPEILKLHDLSRDPGAGTLQEFENRSKKNFENRCLHHHVFDTRLAVEIFNHKQIQILSVQVMSEFHIIILAKKRRDKKVNNKKFLRNVEDYKICHPFLFT
jgi:SAM-dependent methyltransferase